METIEEATGPAKSYFALTRTATYGFLGALPLLIAYEALIHVVNVGAPLNIRIGAEVWMKQVLALVGGPGRLLFALVVVIVGMGIVYYERRKDLRIRPRYFAWMIAESFVYAIVFALIISSFVAFLFLAAPAVHPLGPLVEGSGLWLQIVLSLGAGFYEELVFRVMLVSGLFWMLNRLIARDTHAYIVAAVIAALIFSAVHYIGALGDPFTLSSFTFRFLFGLALNALYVVRGFGVAAWTHALYDVMLVLYFWG